jgi:hypothetical protein
MKNCICYLILVIGLSTSYAQKPIVYINKQTGELEYKKDSLGNQVPDFSYVGYYKGEKEIPKIPIVKTIEPVEGDNRRHIQKAIRETKSRAGC